MTIQQKQQMGEISMELNTRDNAENNLTLNHNSRTSDLTPILINNEINNENYDGRNNERNGRNDVKNNENDVKNNENNNYYDTHSMNPQAIREQPQENAKQSETATDLDEVDNAERKLPALFSPSKNQDKIETAQQENDEDGGGENVNLERELINSAEELYITNGMKIKIGEEEIETSAIDVIETEDGEEYIVYDKEGNIVFRGNEEEFIKLMMLNKNNEELMTLFERIANDLQINLTKRNENQELTEEKVQINETFNKNNNFSNESMTTQELFLRQDLDEKIKQVDKIEEKIEELLNKKRMENVKENEEKIE